VPPDRCRKALINRVQPGTPARAGTDYVYGHGTTTVSRRHGHHSEQFDSQLSLPTTDTRPDRTSGGRLSGRILALDHGSLYRHRS